MNLCFVLLKAYPLLSGRLEVGSYGGAEVQQVRVVRALAQLGHHVSVVTLDHGQEDGEIHDGIRILKCYRSDAGLPRVRLLHPRASGLWRALTRADAAVYFQRNNGWETGLVGIWCTKENRRFVYCLSSDTNCDPALPGLRTRHERWLYRLGLRLSHTVIAQTHRQRRHLRAHFGLDSVVIRSCLDDPIQKNPEATRPRHGEPRRVLWVGRDIPEKRLALMIHIASDCPMIAFDVAGVNASDAAHFANEGASPSNITFHGQVPYSEMGALYRRASIVLCTSSLEGFPNSLLEAWGHGIPVVTSMDPDDMVQTKRLGIVGETRDQLAAGIHALLDDPVLWTETSKRARAHFLSTHLVATAAAAFVDVAKRVCSANKLINRKGESR